MEHSARLKKGIFFIILSALMFAFMNLFVSLSGDVPIIQKTFFRNVFALMIVSWAMVKNKHPLLPKKSELFDLLMRAGFGYLGVCCNFYALSNLHVADASLLNKMSPFFAIIFSGLILKERASNVQWLIVLAAFGGALFVIRPSFENVLLLPSLAGLVGGAAAGLAYAFLRRASSKGTPGYYIVFFFSAFSTLCALPFVIIGYQPMEPAQLLSLVGAGTAAAGGQFSITAAYSYAPAKEVSVYDYSSIIFTAILGFIFMGQVPDALSFVGYVIIIAAAIVMFLYNNRKSEGKKQAGSGSDNKL